MAPLDVRWERCLRARMAGAVWLRAEIELCVRVAVS
jgi:hypothetical protein